MTALMGHLTPGVREERRRMIQVLQIRTLADPEHRLEHGLADDAQRSVLSLVEAETVLLQAPGDLKIVLISPFPIGTFFPVNARADRII